MPTVASVPRRALAIRRDNTAASAGWSGEVQMPGTAAGGAAGGVLAGLGVPAGASVLAGACARTGAGAAAEPEMSSAETARAYQGHRPGRRIVITLLRQRKTLGSEAGVTMSSACEDRESSAGRGQTRLLGHVVRDRRQIHRRGATIHGEHGP